LIYENAAVFRTDDILPSREESAHALGSTTSEQCHASIRRSIATTLLGRSNPVDPIIRRRPSHIRTLQIAHAWQPSLYLVRWLGLVHFAIHVFIFRCDKELLRANIVAEVTLQVVPILREDPPCEPACNRHHVG